MSQHYQDLSFDTVIPSAILVNDNIELTAVKLFAFIKGLTKLHGYCYATNEYLAKLMKSTARAIQNWLVQLKKEGYVEIETEKNGIHWQRRIYISDRFKKCLRKEPQFTPPRTTVHPSMNHGSPITKDYSNEDKLKREEAYAPPPLIFSYKRVKMVIEKFDQLVSEFGEQKTHEMLDRLDEYADINPKRFKQYACHATVIRKWIREDKGKRPTQAPKATENKEGDSRTWWNGLAKIFGPYERQGKLYTGSDYVEFSVRGNMPEKLYFKDPKFQEMAKNYLRKLEIFV